MRGRNRHRRKGRRQDNLRGWNGRLGGRLEIRRRRWWRRRNIFGWNSLLNRFRLGLNGSWLLMK